MEHITEALVDRGIMGIVIAILLVAIGFMWKRIAVLDTKRDEMVERNQKHAEDQKAVIATLSEIIKNINERTKDLPISVTEKITPIIAEGLTNVVAHINDLRIDILKDGEK